MFSGNIDFDILDNGYVLKIHFYSYEGVDTRKNIETFYSFDQIDEMLAVVKEVLMS